MNTRANDDRPDLTRRAALAGAAALGGAGVASLVGADKAFAATSEYFINAIDYGVAGNGTTNDTTALQSAINAAIAADKPLWLPPGRYRTTSGLKAESSNFAIFGAGTRNSVIAPDTSSFDTLTIGPAEGVSGNDPSGYARDFGIDGGNAEWDKSGVSSVTGKAAFKLRGMTLFEVTNVAILSSANFDIGFDLTANCFGTNFRNCRTGLDGCRVGVNIRSGPESGNDVSFFTSWLFGEVAAVHVSPSTNGFHFYGGQMTSSREPASAEDNRGALIVGKDYLTGSTSGSAPVNLTFDGIDFEGFEQCWAVRTFKEAVLTFRNCSFLANNVEPALGFFKGSDVDKTHISLDHNLFADDFSGGTGMVVIEGDEGSMVWEERGSWGDYEDPKGETNAVWEPLMKRCKLPQGVGWMEGPIMVLNGFMVRRGVHEEKLPRTLEVSEDWGSAWTSISPTMVTVASAATITVPRGVPFVRVTGTTPVKTITPTLPGDIVVLQLTTAGGMIYNGMGNLKLASNYGAGNLRGTLTVVCDGTNWFELSHSNN